MKIIAEIGSVHNGSLQFAKNLVKYAAKSGADIVKFQMHIAEYETLKMHLLQNILPRKIDIVILKEQHLILTSGKL